MPKLVRLMPVLLVLALAGCLGDTFDASYDSVEDAVSEGGVSRGWIPAWLPSEAVFLREVHDIDTNENALAFDMKAGTSWKLPDRCKPVAFEKLVHTKFDRDWWPSKAEMKSSYAFFHCEGTATWPEFRDSFVGIRADGRRALRWQPYS